jgi:hypothetical protein
MNAKAATRAVAAVPCRSSLVRRMRGFDSTYRMLHACDEDLLRVEPLSVLPVYPCYTNGVFGAYRPTQRGEMVVRSTLVTGLVFIQRERTV